MKRPILFAILDRLHYLVAFVVITVLNLSAPTNAHKTLYVVLAVYVALAEIYFYVKSKDRHRLGTDVLATLSLTSQKRIQDFPLPVVICDTNGDIVWYDEAFVSAISAESLHALKNVKTIDASILARRSVKVFFDQKHYNVFSDTFLSKGKEKHILYFIDITDFKKLQRQYNLTRPIVAHIVVDNYDELFGKARESEKSSAMAQIDQCLANWAQSVGGLLKKTSGNKYLFLFCNKDLSVFTEDRFSILDEIRGLDVALSSSPTISIGIGMGNDTFYGNDEDAAMALEMALSRGGDQAVIKEGGAFEFFGGASKGMEKRTKVKARVVASSLRDLLKSVDTVLVMGHQFADFDSLGACVGVARIALESGKRTGIVYDKNSSLSDVLYKSLEASPEIFSTFVSAEDAMMMNGENTLVVVVDTHRAGYTVMPELLRYARHIAVIDHHRKSADFIDNAELFFHEPYASSVCEMVTEMLGYMDVKRMPAAEAEALFAGICLDTKNFTLRTSNYTFEASSYLRKLGADPVNVKRFFQTDMATYRRRGMMVQKAEIYRDIVAIATWDEPVDASSFRIIASQAADEMLGIEGVGASFTLFEDEQTGNINVSGRSLGNVNVQLITEKLGGGGHQTMAGAQLKDIDLEEARDHLCKAIDDYISENKL